MACPDFQSLTLPVLQSAAGGQELTLAALRAETARRLGLSEADLSERIPSGKQTRYSNRVNWACIYMSEAGLLEWVVGRDGRFACRARIAGLRLRRRVGAGGHEAEDVARRRHVTSPAVRAPRRTASAGDR